MIKKLIFIMCFVPFPVFADELKVLPSIYVDNEIRENLIKYPEIIDNGYVLIEEERIAKLFFSPIPPDVNFEIENILLFSWSGSGQDEIEHNRDEDGIYNFVYKRGLTKDLVNHIKIYVLKKNDKFLFHRVLN